MLPPARQKFQTSLIHIETIKHQAIKRSFVFYFSTSFSFMSTKFIVLVLIRLGTGNLREIVKYAVAVPFRKRSMPFSRHLENFLTINEFFPTKLKKKET